MLLHVRVSSFFLFLFKSSGMRMLGCQVSTPRPFALHGKHLICLVPRTNHRTVCCIIRHAVCESVFFQACAYISSRQRWPETAWFAACRYFSQSAATWIGRGCQVWIGQGGLVLTGAGGLRHHVTNHTHPTPTAASLPPRTSSRT